MKQMEWCPTHSVYSMLKPQSCLVLYLIVSLATTYNAISRGTRLDTLRLFSYTVKNNPRVRTSSTTVGIQQQMCSLQKYYKTLFLMIHLFLKPPA